MKKKIEYPETVAIETTNRCNARCTFCPNNRLARDRTTMHDKLFEKIVNDCTKFNPKYIEPFLNGEPLMDKKIFERIKLIKTKLPKTKIKLYTNASLFTPEKTDQLAEIGIDTLFVSLNTLNSKKYREIMGLDLEKTLDNLKYLIYRNKDKSVTKKMTLRMTRTDNTSLFDQDQFVKYCKENKIPSYIVGLFNYKGEIKSHLPIPNYPCEHIDRIDILASGKTALCCMDQEGKYSWGDVNNESILDIYNGKKASLYKTMQREGKRDKLPPCNKCNMFWPTLKNVSFKNKIKMGIDIAWYFLNNKPSGKKKPEE